MTHTYIVKWKFNGKIITARLCAGNIRGAKGLFKRISPRRTILEIYKTS